MDSMTAELVYAINVGDNDRLEQLIRQSRVDLNLRTRDGATLLTRALVRKNNTAVELLINAGADVNISCFPDTLHLTPFLCALNDDNGEAVRLLIAAGANVKIGVDGCRSNTPMMCAVSARKRQCVMALAQFHGLIDQPNNEGIRPLWLAINAEDTAMISLLCDLGCDKEIEDKNGVTALLLAMKSGNIACIQALIDAGVDVNHNNPLLLAVKLNLKTIAAVLAKAKASYLLEEESDGEIKFSIFDYLFHEDQLNEEMLIVLIKNYSGSDLDDNSWRKLLKDLIRHGFLKALAAFCDKRRRKIKQDIAETLSLHYAARNGNESLVNQFLSVGADVNHIHLQSKQTALIVAAIHGYHSICETFIQNGANVNAQNNKLSTALIMAARNGHSKIVDQLIRANADVNITDNLRQTALTSAAHSTNCQSVELLLNSSINLNLICQHDFRQIDWALLLAVKFGNSPVVDLLLQQPTVNANAAHHDTQYAIMHYASRYPNAKIVKSLIDAGANVNCSNIDGHTPLHTAALFGNVTVAAALLECGADISAVCVHGFTPSQISGHYGDRECLAILQQNNASSDKSCRGTAQDNLEFSHNLHSSMISAGFSRSRAVLQSATADVLQQIQVRRDGNQHQFIVGSLSDGWGNSLRWLTGKTDSQSDIDITLFVPGKVYHIRGRCRCNGVTEECKVDCENGHVVVTGLATSPSIAFYGTSERPAFDEVKGFRICNYPHMEVIHNHRRETQFSAELLQSLRAEAERPNCHAVAAACPGMQGQHLRLSTTFLEKIVMRSLSTVQGQVFILLKFLIKKVLGERDTGLKSYHAKCLLFHLLDRTPSTEWHSRNMIKLLLAALQILLDNLGLTEAADNECMRHFFLQDAVVFLKNRTSNKEAIVAEVRSVMLNVRSLLNGFKDSLRSCLELFFFHPFQYLPEVFTNDIVSVNNDLTEFHYHRIYDAVRQCLSELMKANCDRALVTYLIRKLPDCAATTRAALQVMLLLKFGQSEEATVELVRHYSRNQSVTRGLTQAADDDNEVTVDFVWQQLYGTDSAYRFCFVFNNEMNFDFLPDECSHYFPIQLEAYHNFYFINFDALLKLMMIKLTGTQHFDLNQWFHQIIDNDDADVQEILLTLMFSDDVEILQQLIEKQRHVIYENEDSANLAETKMKLLPPQATVRRERSNQELSFASRFLNFNFLLVMVLLIALVIAVFWPNGKLQLSVQAYLLSFKNILKLCFNSCDL